MNHLRISGNNWLRRIHTNWLAIEAAYAKGLDALLK